MKDRLCFHNEKPLMINVTFMAFFQDDAHLRVFLLILTVSY